MDGTAGRCKRSIFYTEVRQRGVLTAHMQSRRDHTPEIFAAAHATTYCCKSRGRPSPWMILSKGDGGMDTKCQKTKRQRGPHTLHLLYTFSTEPLAILSISISQTIHSFSPSPPPRKKGERKISRIFTIACAISPIQNITQSYTPCASASAISST